MAVPRPPLGATWGQAIHTVDQLSISCSAPLYCRMHMLCLPGYANRLAGSLVVYVALPALTLPVPTRPSNKVCRHVARCVGCSLTLIQTAEMLRSKRKELHEVSLAVNETKLEIDRVRGRLEQWEEARLVTSGCGSVGG